MLSKNWTLQIQRNASTDELYFVTLTVVDWIDVFTRRYYNPAGSSILLEPK